MPFDSAPSDDDGDPAAALRAWARIRISCIEAMVAADVDLYRREIAFTIALIDHEVWQFAMIWGFQPDMGLLGDRLDLLRAALGRKSL